MLSEDPQELVGQLVAGRYQVDSVLARGGMGVIYKARQQPVDRTVALKVMSRLLSNSETARQRFFREARVVSGLRHPNTVTLIDFGEADGLLYQVFEYYAAGNLLDVLSFGAIGPARAMRIARQIAGALQEAHEQGIVHRDVKPENILVDQVDGDDFARVLDFGVARSKKVDEVLTASGVMVGTPEYGSPEQAKSLPVDHRSDIYSLGVVLFTMLAGALPYSGGSKVTIMMAHVRAPIPSLRERGVMVGEGLDGLIRRMMAKKPEQRPQSMTEVREALEQLQRSGEARTVPAVEAFPERGESEPPESPAPEPADTFVDEQPPASMLGGATRWLKRIVKPQSD